PDQDHRLFSWLADASNEVLEAHGLARPADSGTTSLLALKRYLSLEVAGKLLFDQIRGNVEEPTDEQVREFVDAHAAIYDSRESLSLYSIFVRVLEPEDEPRAKGKIEEAYRMLQEGHLFSHVAMLYSDAGGRGLSGSAGTIFRGGISPEIEKIVFDLEPNTPSQPVRVGRGYYIFLVTNKKPGFSLENPEDYKSVAEGWKNSVAAGQVEQLFRKYQEKHPVMFVELSSDGGLFQPWMVAAHTGWDYEPIGIVQAAAAQRDYGMRYDEFDPALLREEEIYLRERIAF